MTNPFDEIKQELITLQQQTGELRKELSDLKVQQCHSNKADSDVIGMDEACILIGRKKPTVYGMRCRREIPCLANGRFLRSDVMKWLETQRKRTKAEIKIDALTSFVAKKKEGKP